MCYDDKSTYQVASLGGMKCIVVAMSNHINNVAVQENACTALKYMCQSDKDGRIHHQLGGIKYIIAAMKNQ